MAKPAPSRVAAALDYLERLKSQAAEFGGGVVENLADRARDVGGLAYEGLLHRLYANSPTPRIDQAAQDLGTIGKAIVTQPIQTGKAIVQGEIDRAQEATTSPRAAGEYAGSCIDPMRIAAALRKTAPVLELDVYHGTPHRFPATEANPLGEFDASKIGTGEGAQAYGHGVYFAEAPQVAEGYKTTLSKSMTDGAQRRLQAAGGDIDKAISEASAKAEKYRQGGASSYASVVEEDLRGLQQYKQAGKFESGSLYKADLPDEMIDRMLDWDKPLSEQPAAVRDALMKNPAVAAEVKRINAQRESLNAQNPRRLTHPVISKLAKKETTAELLKGQALYELLAKGGNQAETSAYLRSLGIPGIRYLDEGSRGASGTGRWKIKPKNGAERIYDFKPNEDVLQLMGATAEPVGTRNFVVFPGEEKTVRILERK